LDCAKVVCGFGKFDNWSELDWRLRIGGDVLLEIWRIRVRGSANIWHPPAQKYGEQSRDQKQFWHGDIQFRMVENRRSCTPDRQCEVRVAAR